MAVNTDLLSQLISWSERHDVEFIRVKGQAGKTENERYGQLAMEAATSRDLKVDSGYKPVHQEAK